MFSPMNVAGPDSRRKQLVAKLSQQAQQHGAANAGVPMPPGAAHGGSGAAALGVGRSFGAPQMRGLPSPQSSQAPNILASLLARLGVGGRPQENEVSGGPGSPISPYGSHYQPFAPAGPGSPIPAGGAQVSLPGSPQTAPTFTAEGPGAVPESAGQIAGPSGAPNASTIVDPGFFTQSNGPVPLGGGLFYDPSTGQVINLTNATGAGSLQAASFGAGRPAVG